MHVYLCGPMTGINVGKAISWRKELTSIISDLNHIAVDPTTNLNKLYYNADYIIPIEPPNDPINSDVIFIQDYASVLDCDIIFANLLDNPLSIGCNFGLGSFYTKRLLSGTIYAHQVSIVVVPEDYHKHPFINCHDIIKSTLEEGIAALVSILKSPNK